VIVGDVEKRLKSLLKEKCNQLNKDHIAWNNAWPCPHFCKMAANHGA